MNAPRTEAATATNGQPFRRRLGTYVGGGLLLVVVGLLVVGMLLPGRYRVERATVVDAEPAEVYAVVSDPRTWAEWTAWTADEYPSLEYEYSGADTGVGAVQSWRADEGNGRLEITAADPATGIAYEMHWADHPPQKGRIDLTPGEAGTTVTWTVRGELGANPISRWFGLAMDGMLGPDHERGLAGLKRRLERQPR